MISYYDAMKYLYTALAQITHSDVDFHRTMRTVCRWLHKSTCSSNLEAVQAVGVSNSWLVDSSPVVKSLPQNAGCALCSTRIMLVLDLSKPVLLIRSMI